MGHGPALLEQQQMRRQTHHIVEVVRHQDDRNVEHAAQLIDLVLQAPAHAAVHRGKRFVEEQDRWIASKRARQGDALTLAA